MNFCILTAGAWGTSLALHLTSLGHSVTLVPHRLDKALTLASARENPRLPGHRLPLDLQIGLEIAPSIMEAEAVLLAAPSAYLTQQCTLLSEALDAARQLRWVITLCKGLEPETNRLPLEVVEERFEGLACGVFSGPGFADQLASGQPTAQVLALKAPEGEGRLLQGAMSGGAVRVYTASDTTGVQLGGSLKNVYATAAGLCDGLGLGDNAKAALLTRALREMVRLGVALGGEAETFYGLSGFGDLILTSGGKTSRNRAFGEAVARGEAPEARSQGSTVEGYRAVKAYAALCRERQLEAPILNELHAVFYEEKPLQEAIAALLERQLKPEAQ